MALPELQFLHKMQFCIQLHTDIWKIILYSQAKLYQLKKGILIASFLFAPLSGN